MSQAPHNPSAAPADSEAAAAPAPKQPPAPKDELDLANMVDDLLAQIDDAGQSLANDVAAEVASRDAVANPIAPGASNPDGPGVEAVVNQVADSTATSDGSILSGVENAAAGSPTGELPAGGELPATPAATPEALQPISHEDLLAQVDSLIQQVQATQPAPAEAASQPTPPPPAAAASAASNTHSAAPESQTFQNSSATTTAAPVPAMQPAEEPTPAIATPSTAVTASAARSSLAAIDDEVSKIAEKMLDQAPGEAPPPAPAPVASAGPTVQARQSSSPASEPAPVDESSEELLAKKPRTTIRVPSLAPLLAKVLAPLSAPLAGKPAVFRQSVGWIACGTIFFSAVLWAVVLTRTPETVTHEPGAFDFKDGNPPTIPVAHAEGEHGESAHQGGHGEPAKGHEEAAGGHGEAKSSDSHGSASKAKAPPKKAPPRKNKAAAKAKPQAESGGHH